MRPTCVTCATKAMYILRACRTERRPRPRSSSGNTRGSSFGAVIHSLALSALVTRRHGRANAKVSPDDNYTCHKAPLGAVATRETVAGGLPFLECSSELSVMAVSVQRHYFYFRPSSPTSVRVWQTCWLAPVPRQSDGRGTRDRTPNSNYREENRQSPATTPPHPPTGSAQTPWAHVAVT